MNNQEKEFEAGDIVTNLYGPHAYYMLFKKSKFNTRNFFSYYCIETARFYMEPAYFNEEIFERVS